MGDDGYMGIHYIILEFYVSNIIDLKSKSQKANKLIVTSVENELANTKVGAGCPEEAVVFVWTQRLVTWRRTGGRMGRGI